MQEHIEFINQYQIEQALIIAENIDFITKCPSLKHLRIIPADSACDNFDYSPLYEMPQIKSLQCPTIYGLKEEYSTSIDCAKIKGLEQIHIANERYENYNTVKTLTGLSFSHYRESDLMKAFSSSVLNTLSIFQSRIKTLDGIQKSPNLQCLYLYYNRTLTDIDALKKVKGSLKALRIENCPQINDFSVLGYLENLELLELSGRNQLSNLNFIKTMKNLKTFIFSMNVMDGDLSACLNLSYVHCQKSRKHYNLKDNQLPKGKYVRGNENLEMWMRYE